MPASAMRSDCACCGWSGRPRRWCNSRRCWLSIPLCHSSTRAAAPRSSRSAGLRRPRQHYADRYAGRESALEYTLALTQQLERMDTEEWRAQSAAGGEPGAVANPIFILGFPRSGTTLLEVALEGNPGMVSPGEHEFLIDAVQEFMRTPAELARLPRASEAEIARLRAAYWSRVEETGIQIGTRILVDKHPLNTLKLPLIARLFPGARIALVYRAPPDVVLSCFRHP